MFLTQKRFYENKNHYNEISFTVFTLKVYKSITQCAIYALENSVKYALLQIENCAKTRRPKICPFCYILTERNNCLPYSQLSPTNPSGQSHLYVSALTTVHVPPLTQGSA